MNKTLCSLRATLTFVLLLLFVACTKTGPSGQQSLILIPTSQEVAIGQGMAQELAKTETTLPDIVWQEYLADVGQKIVAVCDRKDIEYHFAVIESDQVNAFATPGGYVYFYTGLLSRMDNEAELAAVMAHEISHVVARHGIKRLQASLGVALAYDLIFGGKDQSKALTAAIQVGLGLAFAGYSRANEAEADTDGMIYMVRAGYNPDGMVTMFEKLKAMGGGSSNIFEQLTADHPETQDRINAAKSQMQQMQLPGNLRTGQSQYQQMRSRLPASNS